jgi:streptogramin lyase
VRGAQHQVLLSALLLASSSVLLLSGCGSALNFKSGSGVPSEVGAMRGTVHGGQFPVVGSTVSLYEIGATATSAAGYAAALPATPLGTATTAADGTWSIPAPTACTNASDELYLVASGGAGGNTGVGQNTTPNAALVMTSVGGPCNNQFTTQFNIDEVTTVATEYALSGFSTDYQHVGTSTTNPLGLQNAFKTVTNLVNLSTGNANSLAPAYATPPASTNADVFAGIVPYDTINTLANIIATCVNAAGGATDSQCTNLFSYTGGANSNPVGNSGVQGPVAANTADAVLYIAHNPGLPAVGFTTNNVAAVWGLPTPEAPFGPPLAAAPNDFTLTLNFVSGGLGGNAGGNLSAGGNLTVDMNGNVWVPAARDKFLASMSNLGSPLSPTTTVTGTTLVAHGGYPLTGAGTLGRLDSDQNGNVWVADSTNCVYGFSQNGTPLAGSPFTADCPATTSHTVTVDGSNNLWVGGTAFVTSLSNPSGAVRTGFPSTAGYVTLTTFLGPDEAGNVWFTDQGNNNGGFISGTGSVSIPYPADFGGSPGIDAAFGQGTLWVPEPSADTIQPVPYVSPFNPGNSFIPPTGIAMAQIRADGSNRFLFSNGGNTTVPPNITIYLADGTQVSPLSKGYTGGSALTALDSVNGIAIDQSGNVWVLNQINYNQLHSNGPYGSQYLYHSGAQSANVTEFVGLAAPTQPVASFNAKNSTYGVKP